MTHILIFKSKEGEYRGFNCIGHAEYADIGEDIVCAAISVLVINTINSMEELAGEEMSVVVNEDAGLIDCRFKSSINEKTVLFMDSFILGLKGIKKQYGKKYLDLAFEEV
ncbi:MAG: ribosomal-processing cysteine protease Prp [Lachnospiraceae bacterium]|nr:ribosomal-processing cysteine protease Prp [Lachnospiraceae bacterium]